MSGLLGLQRSIGNQAVSRLFGGDVLQRKLHVGRAGDRYEREADQVAAEVMRTVTPLVTPDEKELPFRRSTVAEGVGLEGGDRAAATEAGIERDRGSGAPPALHRLSRGVVQREIDRDRFIGKLSRERPLDVTPEQLKQNPLYVTLIASIDRYNRQPSRTRLNGVKSALALLDSILHMHFINAYDYLNGQIAREESRLSQPRTRSKKKDSQLRDLEGPQGLTRFDELPPLREGPKPGDRRFMPDDELPPLREGPKPGDRRFMPDDELPPLREGPKPGDRRFMADDELPPLRERPKTGDRRFMLDDDDELEEKGHGFPGPFGQPAWRQERPTLPLKEEKPFQFAEDETPSRKKKSKGRSQVPYEEAVAARFEDKSGPIFQKLWRTASPGQRERIQSLFSVKKRHANLSGLEYALEALDPQHRVRAGLGDAARKWANDSTDQYFFTWLESRDRSSGMVEKVEYFDEEQRKDYKLTLGPSITYSKSNKPLRDDNIYAVSQSNNFYASDRSISDRGLVHHSSFLAGQAVKAAGHMAFKSPGKLATINLSSGHYMPKPEHMRNALLLLKRANVKLDEVTAHPDAGAGEGFNAQKWLDDKG